MINNNEIFETIQMINQQHLDVRTTTLGISLLDCICDSPKRTAEKVYDKITKSAKNLVKTANDLASELGIPIVNKRVSVTPISLITAINTKPFCSLAANKRATRVILKAVSLIFSAT